eukprot:CAMPEP_0197614672 /NCGR_PEP_ID=MMETSP1326-20131121/59645_1 /TAXON_ID=1155430 /ORGANISM="Genus nov. species nov., Strain RCC2288" /LENGTH=429 /DNA_ID=CAMNT_0043183549 /DNA_START=129 /DNA_END=1415 /DNA_ORIENTATION=+
MAEKKAECVQVVVRCRPLFGKEINEGRQRVVDMDGKTGQVTLRNPKADANGEVKSFTFDKIFDWNCTQREMYDGAAAGIVDAAIEGYNGTIFCYGQTGTGKTHSMEGKDEPPEMRGIIPNAFNHVFDSIYGQTGSEGKDYLVRASFLEIYNEDIRDLLARDQTGKCELKETPDSGVYVKDLTAFVVKGVSELNNVLNVGKKNRTVGSTLMNADSSRSHSIFTITIETSEVMEGEPEEDAKIRVGKLNLVDLAGSERQGKTGATGDRLKEATKINMSGGQGRAAGDGGIVPNTFETVFADIDATGNKNFLVRASFLEIYNEDVRDLLSKDQTKKCDLKETPDTGVYVKDLTSFVVKGVAEIRQVLEVGKKNRTVGSTLMNADSSRSHSIFTITIETSERREGDAPDDDPHIRVGKLNLVDLAGSERQGKT